MRRFLAFLLALLLPLSVAAQGVNWSQPWANFNPWGDTDTAPLAEYRFDRTGQPWAIPGATVCDAKDYPAWPWDGSNAKWTCSDGTILTPSGAPKPHAPSGLWPGGFGLSDAQHVGVSGFSAEDYLVRAGGLDFAGDYTVALIYSCTSTAGPAVLVGDHTGQGTGGAGWWVMTTGAGEVWLMQNKGLGSTVAGKGQQLVGLNVFCGGRVGGTGWGQGNDAPGYSGAADSMLPAEGVPATIGRSPLEGTENAAQYCTVFEFLAVSRGANEAYCSHLIRDAYRCTTPGACWSEPDTVTHVAGGVGEGWAAVGDVDSSEAVYRWPNGYVPGMAPAASFAGTDGFSSDAMAAPAGSWYACWDFSTSSTAAADAALISRGGWDGSTRSIDFYRYGDYVYFAVRDATNTATATTGVLITPNVLYSACGAYQFVAAGTSRLSLAVAEVTRESTTAVGPVRVGAAPWYFGRETHASARRWSGLFTGWAFKDGEGPTLAELQAKVRARYGMTGTRGEPVTVTGPSTTVCRGSTCWTTPANTLAIGPEGALVYGARTSRVLQNQRDPAATSTGGMLAAAWTKMGDAAVAPGCVTAPDGSCTADRITFGGGEDAIAQWVEHTPDARMATCLWVRRVDAEGTVFITNPGGSDQGTFILDLAELPDEWVRLTEYEAVPGVTVDKLFYVTSGGNTGLNFSAVPDLTLDTWRPWQVEGARCGPDARVADVPLSVAEAKFQVTKPTDAVTLCWMKDGAWQAPVDATALPNPVVFGGGGVGGAVNGAIKHVKIWRTPQGVCQ